ncbi:hypothetical protein [Longimicrobium sp.]|uniref:hypothetical protein n=1 Tax=Longimicrobium sp. TaxID=2029185 RepID=UPI002E32CB00|nr:hypothetical protein [Longimicrobium sp.]HEX6038873.1 hypothetical protein [Longimicrobium sp.]
MRKTDAVLLACVPWTALAALGWAVLTRPAPVTARAQQVKVVTLTTAQADELAQLQSYISGFGHYLAAKNGDPQKGIRPSVSRATAIAGIIGTSCRYRSLLTAATLETDGLLAIERNDVTTEDMEDTAFEAARCIERRRLRAGL